MYCIAGEFGSCRRNDDGVLHRAFFLELAHHVGNRRSFLADGDIDAFDARADLVDDRIDCDGGLAGLPVADDQLTLAPTDRHHRVDGFQPGLHRLVDGFSRNDARRDLFDRRGLRGLDRALAVDRVTERIDHTTEQRFADRHLENSSRSLDRVAFRDVLVIRREQRRPPNPAPGSAPCRKCSAGIRAFHRNVHRPVREFERCHPLRRLQCQHRALLRMLRTSRFAL